MNDRIKELQRQIELEKNKISNCGHQFTEPRKETRYKKEGYGYKSIAQGSDIWGEYEGYRDVPYVVYVRQCKLCGYTQETENVVPSTITYKPDFK